MGTEQELLTGVSLDELEALAAGVLIPAKQARLDELIEGARQNRLTADEDAELDDLLNKVDQLNLLRARAQYTIQQFGAKVSRFDQNGNHVRQAR
jgi:hypothetical protein